MYAMTIAASALCTRLESHSFQPGFLRSFILFTSLLSLTWLAKFALAWLYYSIALL